MFYIKENLNDTISISVEINNENVYCRCPQCGAEVPVDLSIFWTAENFDIFSSAVYCDACTKKRLKGGSGDRWCMVVVSSCREMLG